MAGFPETRWSVVLVAGAGDDGPARAALAWLCERYWEPLVAHARRRGWRPHSAEDLVQDLLLQLLRGQGLRRLDPCRGRFRSWLCACLDHTAGHERDRRNTLRRGGGAGHSPAVEPAVADPEPIFDRDWALAVLARAHDRLAAEENARDGGSRLRALGPLLAGGNRDRFRDAGQDLGLNEGAVKVALHRLRIRLREAVRAEIAETLADPTPEAVADEWATLQAALERDVTGTTRPVSTG